MALPTAGILRSVAPQPIVWTPRGLPRRQLSSPAPASPVGTIQASPQEEKKPEQKKREPRADWTLGEGATFEPVSGHSGTGFKPKGREIAIRDKRNYGDSRIEQVLGEIAIQLYFAVKEEKETPTEVEAMYAGGSLFLSANGNAATQKLYDILMLKSDTDLRELMAKTYGRGVDKKVTERVGGKLKGLYDDTRQISQAKEVLKCLGNQVCHIDLRDEDAEFLSSLALNGGGMTFVVFGQEARHAEVKLVKVLENAGWKDEATIQGKKRPCYTCAAYMRHRKGEGYEIQFSDHPGKVWKDEYERSEADVRDEVKRALKEPMDSHRTKGSEKYRSDSESDSEDMEPTPKKKMKPSA